MTKKYRNLLESAQGMMGKRVKRPTVTEEDTSENLTEAKDAASIIKVLRDTDYRNPAAFFKMVQLLKGLASMAEKDATAKKYLSSVSDALTRLGGKGDDEDEDEDEDDEMDEEVLSEAMKKAYTVKDKKSMAESLRAFAMGKSYTMRGHNVEGMPR